MCSVLVALQQAILIATTDSRAQKVNQDDPAKNEAVTRQSNDPQHLPSQNNEDNEVLTMVIGGNILRQTYIF